MLFEIGLEEAQTVRVVNKIGAGSFGEVWRATHPQQPKNYALKHIDVPQLLKSRRIRRDEKPLLIERVKREASVCVPSEYVVRAHGFRERDGHFFLLFDFVAGDTLWDWLANHLNTPWTCRKTLFLKMLRGVSDLHRAGVLHRDLNPGNVLVTVETQTPKIVDFGLVKIDGSTLTEDGDLSGTWAYKDPFIVKGWGGIQQATAASDVYALGIMLYEMIVGLTPWKANNIVREDFFNQIAGKDNVLELDRAFRLDAPSAEVEMVKDVIRRSTMFDREQRLQTVDEMLALLGQPTPIPSQEGKTMAQPAPQGNAGVKFPSWEGRGVGSHNKETPPKKRPLIEVVTRLFSAKTPSTPPHPSPESGAGDKPTSPPAPNLGAGPGVGSTWTEPTTGMVFMYIPGGTFLMGSPESEKDSSDMERPQHRVTVAPFWMGTYPVTQAEWQKIMGKNPSYFKGERRPVETVSWNACQAFLKNFRSLGDFGNLTPRLPSEAEWEYACRAGTQTAYSFGDDPAQLGDYAWYSENSGGETHPVGQLKPNAFGLCDMHGNVWEWCADIYHENYTGAPTDGRAWERGDADWRVLRGGSWYHDVKFLRCAVRFRYIWQFHWDLSWGFRLVCSRRVPVSPCRILNFWLLVSGESRGARPFGGVQGQRPCRKFFWVFA